jgi:YggT family protein
MVITILEWAIVIRAVLSWFPNAQSNSIARIINEITEPLIRPFRRIRLGGAVGMVDFSPLFALIALMIIRSFVLGPLYKLLVSVLLT